MDYFNLLNAIPAAADIDINNMENIDALNNIPAIEEAPRLKLDISLYDSKFNIASDNQKAIDSFCKADFIPVNPIITAPITTMTTMSGNFSNLSFNEKDALEKLAPTNYIVKTYCKHGTKEHLDYWPAELPTKSNRGRKKTVKNKKKRKNEGVYPSMYSQLSCCVLLADPNPNSPNITKLYKFKIFLTGAIQLPGMTPHDLQNMLFATRLVRDLFASAYEKPENPIKLINLNHNLKNFKFRVGDENASVPDNRIIDMIKLVDLLKLPYYKVPKMLDFAELPENIDFNMTIVQRVFIRKTSKLQIRFATPNELNSQKKTLATIYMSRKINIQGAYCNEDLIRIYNFLFFIFSTNGNLLVNSLA